MRQFGELEAVIMDRLWEWGRPALVREMVDDLREDRPLAYTTVMTVMDNLHRKGWLRRERDGRAWRYEPTGSRSGYTAALMNEALGTSADRRTALAHFVLQMSPHDAALLREALDQALRRAPRTARRVTVAVVLLAYAACVGTLGARLLGRARWTARAPLLAIVTYLAAGWSVVAALGLAGLTLAVHATALGGGLSQLIGACVLRLRDTYATPGGATVAGLGLALAGGVAARTAAHRVDPPARRPGGRRCGTRRPPGWSGARAGAGRRAGRAPEPAAYCVAGRHPTVVLTTGALGALDPGQLAAVLAHERAHLAGHHHRLLALARIAPPGAPVPAADAGRGRAGGAAGRDARRRRGAGGPATRSLATALVVLATGASPAPGLAAAATDAVQRIHRLLGPPSRWAAGGGSCCGRGCRARADPGAARPGPGPARPGARARPRRRPTGPLP